MNAVFSTDWKPFHYSIDPFFVFRSLVKYIFIDGTSDPTATNNYLVDHQTIIYDWIIAGGKLYLNIGNSFQGPVTLSCGLTMQLDPPSASAIAKVNPLYALHPLLSSLPELTAMATTSMNFGFLDPRKSYIQSGTKLLEGQKLFPLMLNERGQPVLVESQMGAGILIVSSFTTVGNTIPPSGGETIRRNIHAHYHSMQKK